jgi:hypothetical protein
LVWIGAGLAALVVGLRLRPGVLSVVLGALAVGYGWLWVEVVRTGRKRPWPFRRRWAGPAGPAVKADRGAGGNP